MRKIIFVTTLILAFLGSCKEEDRIVFMDSEAPAPTAISEVVVEERSGGALISYRVPDDPNFAYAKAVYEIRTGVYREAKASRYADTLALVGYGDTLTHEVKLYSVGKNEKESAPLSFSIQPLRPAVQSAFEKVNLEATFGGVQLSFENSAKANLSIELMVDTTQDRNSWSTVNTFYTAASEGVFSARGFDEKEMKFGVFIRDRWNNKSDTLLKILTPKFEEAIPKTLWKVLPLPTDTWEPAQPKYALENLWDDIITNYDGLFASSNATTMPQWFTVDLGQKVTISRMRIHHQPGAHLYQGSCIKTAELWGSNNPDPDGGWENWEYMGTFNSFKPSGLPMGTNTDEDRNYGWFLGEEFAFEELTPAFRYIRWKTLEAYSSPNVVVAEFDIYGQIEP